MSRWTSFGRAILIGGMCLAYPASRAASRLRASLPVEAARLVRMRANASEILALRGQGVTGVPEAGALAVVEPSLNSAGLRAYVASVTQGDADGVNVNLERVPFSRLAWWLNELRSRRGVRVERATLQRADAGLVDAQVQLR